MMVRIRGSSFTQGMSSDSQHEAHFLNSASVQVTDATASISSMGMNQSVSFSVLQA